jgi:diguanylate cyclase (GGDEF)-like protein
MLTGADAGLTRPASFVMTVTPSLDEALSLLQGDPFDALLVSVAVPAQEAMLHLAHVRDRHPTLPIVVVLDRDDERLAVEAASRGVQDCIVRNELVGNLLARSLQYAVERQQLQAQLERRSVVDELTGLYNRRGFFAMGEQEWRRARRRGEGFLLVYADLDGLKAVNDGAGHDVGDAMIKDAARALAAVFRGTDILARLGGDEFAVIAHHTGPGSPEVIRERIAKVLEGAGPGASNPHPVSFSLGIVAYAPATDQSVGLDQLLSRADALMYEDKRRRRADREAKA